MSPRWYATRVKSPTAESNGYVIWDILKFQPFSILYELWYLFGNKVELSIKGAKLFDISWNHCYLACARLKHNVSSELMHPYWDMLILMIVSVVTLVSFGSTGQFVDANISGDSTLCNLEEFAPLIIGSSVHHQMNDVERPWSATIYISSDVCCKWSSWIYKIFAWISPPTEINITYKSRELSWLNMEINTYFMKFSIACSFWIAFPCELQKNLWSIFHKNDNQYYTWYYISIIPGYESYFIENVKILCFLTKKPSVKKILKL